MKKAGRSVKSLLQRSDPFKERIYAVENDVLFAIRRRRGSVIRMGSITSSHVQAARMSTTGKHQKMHTLEENNILMSTTRRPKICDVETMSRTSRK